MRIRLIGDHGQVAGLVNLLRRVTDVTEVSAPYQSRGETTHVRVYVTATLSKTGEVTGR